MYTVRIHSQLEDRLDAEFYNPEALKTVQKIDGLGKTKRLGQLIADGYRVVYHGTDSINGIPEERLLPFLSPTQIDDQGSIDFSAADKLPLYYKDDYPKGLAVAGELLIEVKGNVSKVGVVPEEFPKHLMVSGSLYKASFKADTNSRYVLAFLKSKHGQILKNRLTSNTIINYIAKDALYSIPLFAANSDVQKYIGDKVRQAERLQAWTKELDKKLTEFEVQIPLQQPVADERKYSKAELDYLTDNRLDAKFYERKHLALEAQFNEKFQKLGVITSGFKYGASVTADYVSQGEGITFIRGNSISKNNINTADIVYLHKRFLDDVSSCRVRTGEVLITRSGTVGVACDVFDEFDGAAYGSFVIKCQPRTEQVLPTYLSWFLNSWVGQQQFRRWENGAVQLNINIEELSSIMVWLAPSEVQNQIIELIEAKRESDKYSRNLTIGAKLLVEDLIEGQITEAQLIAAEQALQAGNDTLDRKILSRLKTDGIDGDGAALFSDLDELYRLLALAEVE